MKLATNVFLFSAVLIGTTAPAFAQIQPTHDNYVTYISGGIGADEQQAIKTSAHGYNLAVTNANKTGDYVADVNLSIQSRRPGEQINISNTGPLFYAKLPPGDYTLKATAGDQTVVRTIRISSDKLVNLHFVWQQS